jgi:membrane fusion protein, multidrug efflux system
VASYSRVGRCYRGAAVPNETYIIANFKETQIAYVRVGRSVSVRVDALPGRSCAATDSFQGGTGSSFAPSPENAMGNFIKTVQRIPVKIILDGPAASVRGVLPGCQ